MTLEYPCCCIGAITEVRCKIKSRTMKTRRGHTLKLVHGLNGVEADVCSTLHQSKITLNDVVVWGYPYRSLKGQNGIILMARHC